MKIFLFILWLCAIVVTVGLAAIPNFMTMENGEDKMLHITAFCFLMMGPTVVLARHRYVFVCVAALLGIGVGIEYIQEFVPGRESSIDDIYADAIGVALGLAIGYLFRGGHNSRQAALASRKDH